MCYEDSISVFRAGIDESTNSPDVKRISHRFEEDKDRGIKEEVNLQAAYNLGQARPSQGKSEEKLALVTD